MFSVYVAVLQPNQKERCSVQHNDRYCYIGNDIAGLKGRYHNNHPIHDDTHVTLSFTKEKCKK